MHTKKDALKNRTVEFEMSKSYFIARENIHLSWKRLRRPFSRNKRVRSRCFEVGPLGVFSAASGLNPAQKQKQCFALLYDAS